MSEIMHDPMTFYAIAFVIFLALAYKYGRAPMLAWLDGEILKIRAELDEAAKLRAEAEALLIEQKRKQAAAMAEAEAIVRHAKEEALRLRVQAETDLKDALVHHEQQASERIRIAGDEAIAEVRAATLDLAMTIARETLATRLDDTTSTKLTEQAMGDVAKLTGGKAKAA